MIDLFQQTFVAVFAFVAMLSEPPPPGAPDMLVIGLALLCAALLVSIVWIVVCVWRAPGEPRVDPLDPYAEAFGEVTALPSVRHLDDHDVIVPPPNKRAGLPLRGRR